MPSADNWSPREVFASASITGNALEFTVVEFPIPPGMKFQLRSWEASAVCRVFVVDTSQILSALAAAVIPYSNPVGFTQAFVGRRTDAGLFGYINRAVSGFDSYNWNPVIDGYGNQRLCWINQVVATALEVSFQGRLFNDAIDVHDRIIYT